LPLSALGVWGVRQCGVVWWQQQQFEQAGEALVPKMGRPTGSRGAGGVGRLEGGTE